MSSIATRRERVVLELEDNFSGPMAKAAAATALLKQQLGGLSDEAVQSSRTTRGLGDDMDGLGKSTDKTSKKTKEYTLETAVAEEKARRFRKSLQDQAKAAVDAEQGLGKTADEVDKVGNNSNNSAKQIDRLSGRMRLLAEAAFVLGPALLPIGAAALPAVLGLAAGFGAAAAGAGVAVLAFQGVGDALKALDAYQLEPTAANLETMQQKMDALGPAGQQMVQTLDSLEPALKQLQEGAREGLFPGVEEGIASLMSLLPEVQRIVSNIAQEMGNLAAEAGKGLSGAGFADFFHYIETDAAPTLEAFGHTIGSIAEGFGHLIVAFAPLTRSFSSGMESMAASFAKWADGLSQTNGFRDFVSYIQESGPKVIDLIGALAQSIVGIATAAAPVGNAVLPALTGLLHVFAAIANSPIGPPLYTAAAGMIALSRATTIATASMGRFGASSAVVGKVATGFKAFGGAAVGILAVSAAIRQINESSRDAMPGVEQMTQQLTQLAESGNAAVLSQQFSDLSTDISRVFNKSTSDSIGDFFYKWSGGQALLGNTQDMQELADEINTIDSALAHMVNTQGPEAAARALQGLADSGAVTDQQLKYIRQHIPQYDEALAGVANQADNAAGSTHGLAAALTAADAKIHASRTAALTTAQGFMKFGDSLGNAKVSLGQWLNELRKQAQALQNFTANAQKAARRGLDEGLIKSLQEAGPVGAMRMRQLANATDAELARANRSWRLGQQAIHQYVNTVGGVPTAKATTLSVHDLATMKIRAIQGQLASINRHIDIYIQTHTSRLPNAGGMGPQIGSADGSTVPKDGRPYADRYHYLLAPGEEVISNRNGQADRWRPLLKAINAGRLADGGTVRGLANGGTASRLFTATDGVDALNRTAHELSKAQQHHIDQLKKEDEHRKKLLEREIQRDQKEADAQKQRLDNLKQERQQIVDAVKDAYRADIFGQQSSGNYQLADMSGSGLSASAIEAMQATLTANGQAAAQQARMDQLHTNLKNEREAIRLLRILHKRGLHGQAYVDLAAQGDVGTLQAFVDMSQRDLMRYERQYQESIKLGRQLGNQIGDREYGKQITRQTEVFKDARDELRQHTHELKSIDKRIGHLEHLAAKAPKETGHHVAKGVNGAATAGAKGRVAR